MADGPIKLEIIVRSAATLAIVAAVAMTFQLVAKYENPGLFGAGFFLVSVGGALFLAMPADLRRGVHPALAWGLMGIGTLFIFLGSGFGA